MGVRKTCWLLLTLAALSLSAFIPSGHMLAMAQNGGIEVIICPSTHPIGRAIAAQNADNAMMASGDHQAHANHQMTGGHEGHSQSALASVDCDLGSVSFAAPLPTFEPLAIIELEQVAALHRILRDLALAERPHLRPPLRGPPLLN